MTGIEILDLDTGEDIIKQKDLMVRSVQVSIGPRGIEAHVHFYHYHAKGGSVVKFEEHYGIGDVELGGWDELQQRKSRRGRKLKKAKEAPMVEAEEETCDECYGSGYWHGIGAPCSKGCKPKD